MKPAAREQGEACFAFCSDRFTVLIEPAMDYLYAAARPSESFLMSAASGQRHGVDVTPLPLSPLPVFLNQRMHHAGC